MVKARLADQQLRAGFDLVSSSALNAVTGLAFWFVAARGFDEAVVGVNAAIIALLSSVENVTSLGMKNTIIRYLPSYGTRGRWLVLRMYGLTAVATLVLTPIIALILVRRIDELALLDSAAGIALFTVACLLWVIFVLQDSVLVALRRTPVIPLANLAYALAKLGLLVVLAVSAPKWGIFTAWTVPLVLVVVGVNVIALRSLRSLGTPAEPDTITPRAAEPETGIVRFAIGENAATILNTALSSFLPIYVLAELGDTASAFFALAWTIAYNLMLASSNVSTALLAAAAQDPNRLVEQAAKSIKQMSLFVIPAATGVALFAPLGLRIFGESYADSGSTLLRLLCVAAIANIPVAVGISMLRAQRRVGRLFGFYALRTLLIGTLCVVLVREHGLNGVGWGWLIGEWLLAILVIVTLLRGVIGSIFGRTVEPAR